MRKMFHYLHKPYRWAMIYGGFLSLCFAFVLLDAFVIPRVLRQVAVAKAPGTTKGDASNDELALVAPSNPTVTATSYEDENIKITIETIREYDTTFHVADIQLTNVSLLKTALAHGVYGRNITDTTSNIAAAHNAIFAINGDYYGFRDTGHVLRNGVLYRDSGEGDTLVIHANGDFAILGVGESDSTAAQSAWQALSFGPVLVKDGSVVVNSGSEVSGKSMNSNPRTAIGQAGPLHYIAIVSDGRTGTDTGLSLYQLAQEFAERGCTVAYNLDGGGSSSMVFMGEILNSPVGNKRNGERKVSDIVYVGYE